MKHFHNLSLSQNRRIMILLVLTTFSLSECKTFADDAVEQHYVFARSTFINSTSAVASSVTNVLAIKTFVKQIKPISDNASEQTVLKLLAVPDDVDLPGLGMRLNLASQNYIVFVSQLLNAKQDATGATVQYNKLAHLSELVGSLAKISDGFRRIESKSDLERIRGLVKLCKWLKELKDKVANFTKSGDASFDQLIENEKSTLEVAILNIPASIMEYAKVLETHGTAEIANLVNGKSELSLTQSADLLGQLSADFTTIRTVVGCILTTEQKKYFDRSAQRFLAGEKLAEILDKQAQETKTKGEKE